MSELTESSHIKPSQQVAHPHINHAQKFIILYLLILVIVAFIGAIYSWQHSKVQNLTYQISQTKQTINSSKSQLTIIDNQNEGTVTSVISTPSNMVSLLNEQVTFTTPSGWVTATASHYNEPCYIGGLAAQFCLATTIVIPKSLNNNNTTSTDSGITISVFKHSDNTNAAAWFTNDFNNEGYDVTANQIPSSTISGYNASIINPSDAAPAYFNTSPYTEYYVFTNKSYIVMLTFSSDVTNSTIQTFASSIKMQGN